MAIAQRFLRQLGSGTIYHYTETLAKRGDMVPFDQDQAKIRIDAAKKNLADLKKLRGPEAQAIHTEAMLKARETSDTLTKLEREIEDETAAIEADGKKGIDDSGDIKTKNRILTDEEIELERKDAIIAKDPHILNIMSMKSKKEVRAYLLAEFGEDPGEEAKYDVLKNIAIGKRTDRLFEFNG